VFLERAKTLKERLKSMSQRAKGPASPTNRIKETS
jgi:hypothetical protein